MKTFACLRHSTRYFSAEVLSHWHRVEWIFQSNKASIRCASTVLFFTQNPKASFGFCLKKKPTQVVGWLCSFWITKWSWRVPNPMLQYADIQFLVSLVSYFGHGLSTMLHDQSLSSFCHELSDNVKVRFSDFKRHFSDNCFLILPL